MKLPERDNKVIWHPYTQMQGAISIGIVRGEGAYLFDEDGRKFIDAISSWWVNTHGHSNKYISEKVSQQLNTLEHVIFAGFTHPSAVELAERLLQHLPQNQKKIFYSDNGSTAVEVALKMAIQFYSNKGSTKRKIVAFKNAYHGDTFGAMSVSGRSLFTNPFSQYLFDVNFIELPVKGREEASFEQLKEILKTDDVSAFIFEPLVQGAAGMLMYEPEILEKMVAYCKINNVITIADEVMTGFHRTGKFFATDHINEKPDIYCLSKGLTGGVMAMGVTSCSQEIFDAFLSDDKTKTLYHGHSYTANPVACSAALASLDLYEKTECAENVKRIENKHSDFFNSIKEHSAITDIRQTGTILAIELKTNDNTSYLNSLRDSVYNFFLNKGIILRPLGNIIYVLPPYCISNDDLNYIYKTIKEFLDENLI
ncbi:MAG: adenosylmethionine--8-amino-7-oxononanoate transaminase [Bacteroidetes bacterium]|nr:adenosylmethionine--8-amino-7-oxononanoate transaminase [Bacteroidota bacterium]